MALTAMTYLGGYIPALPFVLLSCMMLSVIAEIPAYRKRQFHTTTACLTFVAYSVIYNFTLWSNHV